MTDPATLTARLAEAEAALHTVVIGQSEAVISFDGKSVTYRSTNVAELRAYIADLQQQLGQGGGRRPRRLLFNAGC